MTSSDMEEAGTGGSALAYLHPVLCQLGLPRRPTSARRWLRSSGADSLLIEAGSVQRDGKLIELDLPYGLGGGRGDQFDDGETAGP